MCVCVCVYVCVCLTVFWTNLCCKSRTLSSFCFFKNNNYRLLFV